MVVTQAHVQQPLRRQFQCVHRVNGACGAGRVGACVVARYCAVPGIIRVRVAQRGAVKATWRAYQGRITGRSRRPVGVGVDVIRRLAAGLTAQFDTGRVAVFKAGDVHVTKQIRLVGGGGRVADARVGPAPYAAVVHVAFTVIRLGQDVILHAVAVAQGVLDVQVFGEVVLKR